MPPARGPLGHTAPKLCASLSKMKQPGQQDFEGSDAHENVRSEQLDRGLDPGSGLDGPPDVDHGESQVSKDPLLFIQLNELLGWPQALEWRETGR